MDHLAKAIADADTDKKIADEAINTANAETQAAVDRLSEAIADADDD